MKNYTTNDELIKGIVGSTALKLGLFNILLLAAFITVVLYYIQWQISRIPMLKLQAQIPNAPVSQLPFLGNAHHLAGGTENYMDKMKLFSKNGTPYTLWLGPKPITILGNAEDIEIAYNSSKTLNKLNVYKFVSDLADGIFSSNIPKWKTHRRLVQPSYNQKNLNDFVDIFVAQTNIMIENLKEDVGKTFDIGDRVINLGLDIICETAMDVKIHAQRNKEPLGSAVHIVMETLMERMFNVMWHSDFIFSFTATGKRSKENQKYIQDYASRIIRERKLKYNNTEFIIKKKAFLDSFLDLVKCDKFTDDNVRDEVITILIAGSDTTATLMGFLCLNLGMNPDVQEKMYQEIIQVLGSHPITFHDLPKFEYTERVIKETLRVFPLGAYLYREVAEDLPITNGYTLAKGSGVGIAAMLVHYDPKHWKDPHTFNPDRFLPEEEAKRHPCSFIPFSVGPRNCIGLKFAMMEMKVQAASIVQNYIIECDYKHFSEVKVKQCLVLQPVDGFPVRVIPRKLM